MPNTARSQATNGFQSGNSTRVVQCASGCLTWIGSANDTPSTRQLEGRSTPFIDPPDQVNGCGGPAEDPSGLKNSTRLVRAAATAIRPSSVSPIAKIPPILSTNQPSSKRPLLSYRWTRASGIVAVNVRSPGPTMVVVWKNGGSSTYRNQVPVAGSKEAPKKPNAPSPISAPHNA